MVEGITQEQEAQLTSEQEAKLVEAVKGLSPEQQEKFVEIVNGAEGEKLSQDESAALLASLGPEVAKYLQLNVVGDISKIPVDTLRSIAMQAGAGRGADLELGIQDRMGIGVNSDPTQLAENPIPVSHDKIGQLPSPEFRAPVKPERDVGTLSV